MVSNYFTWVAVVAMVVIYLQPVHCENFDPSNPRGSKYINSRAFNTCEQRC